MRATLITGLLVSMAAATPLAQASGVGEAGIDHLSFTLVDLNLNDGVAPSISFSGNNLVFNRLNADWMTWNDGISQSGSGALHLSDFNGAQIADAAVRPQAVGSSQWQLGAYATGVPTLGSYQTVAQAFFNQPLSGGSGFGGFVLSANTRLVVTGHASTYAGALALSPSFIETANAQVTISLFNDSQSQTFRQTSIVGTEGKLTEDQKSGNFELSFSNLSGLSTTGFFAAHATAAAESYVTSVPEPGSPLLMGAGMGVLLFVRRRATQGARS